MLIPERKRARFYPPNHQQVSDVPPPPPKRPSMVAKVKHQLILPSTVEILNYSWRTMGSNGKYQHTSLSDPTRDCMEHTYKPKCFDILGEKLDEAFKEVASPDASTDMTISFDLFSNSNWKIEAFNVPLPESLELKPLYSPLEGHAPPPPPPPASWQHRDSQDQDRRQTAGELTQLENSQYSPSRPTEDSDMEEGSDAEYLSAEDEFPPPAPSPPDFPSTPVSTPPPPPSPPQQTDDHDPKSMEIDDGPSRSERSSYPSNEKSERSSYPSDERSARSSYPSNERSARSSYPSDEKSERSSCPSDEKSERSSCPSNETIKSSLDGVSLDEEQELYEKERDEIRGLERSHREEMNEEEMMRHAEEEEILIRQREGMSGGEEAMVPEIEDIDSPDELEEDDVNLLEDMGDKSQISLFREVISDGQVKRVLYFRKSKFRVCNTAQYQLDKMRMRMDYQDACRESGYPETPNKGPRPSSAKLSLSDRIENPRHCQPLLTNPNRHSKFGVPVNHLTRKIRQHDHSTAVKFRNFGIPLRQLRPQMGKGGVCHQGRPPLPQQGRPALLAPQQGRPRVLAPPRRQLNKTEKLLTTFCRCWVERPFHDQACSEAHDNFVEIIMNRNKVKYMVVKQCVQEYWANRRAENIKTRDPIGEFNNFKNLLKKNRQS